MFQYIRTAKETQLGKMAAARDGGWGLGGQSSECVGKEDYFVPTVPEMVSSGLLGLANKLKEDCSVGGLPMLGRRSLQTPKAVCWLNFSLE